MSSKSKSTRFAEGALFCGDNILRDSIRGMTGEMRSELELREPVPEETLLSLREGVDTAVEEEYSEFEDAEADGLPDIGIPIRPSGTW